MFGTTKIGRAAASRGTGKSLSQRQSSPPVSCLRFLTALFPATKNGYVGGEIEPLWRPCLNGRPGPPVARFDI
jgi:hypothetical protein